jgi:hypothetical protein
MPTCRAHIPRASNPTIAHIDTYVRYDFKASNAFRTPDGVKLLTYLLEDGTFGASFLNDYLALAIRMPKFMPAVNDIMGFVRRIEVHLKARGPGREVEGVVEWKRS